jgi:hypothetical protein
VTPPAAAPSTTPTTTPTTAPGNAVADTGTGGALADAVEGAGTFTPGAASKAASAQVPANDADTAVVTASAAQSSSNPFARP